MNTEKFIVGCEEWCNLPDMGIPAIKAKIDSGANVSALHAFNIITSWDGATEYVNFSVHPIQNTRHVVVQCKVPIAARRVVKSSNGIPENRIIIVTPLKIGGKTWDIEISLTNRDSMGYRMLLGKEAMRQYMLVDMSLESALGDINYNELQSYYTVHSVQNKPLHIGILASNPNLYSNRRIIEACEMRGHQATFLQIKNCYIHIGQNGPTIFHRKLGELQNIDAVIPRLKPSMTFYGCALTRQFQSMGAFCLNGANAIANSRDKLKCLQILSTRGMPMPATSFASSPLDTCRLIEAVGGTPIIAKLLEGTQGKGVVLLDNLAAAESVISAFKCMEANILVQEFISEANGEDIRCFVVGGKVIAAMKRKAKEGDFRSNFHLGGTVAPVKIKKIERKIAVTAVKMMGLHVAGIDMVRAKDGPKILEVNSSPGLEGIEKASGLDIATSMILCIEKNVYGCKKKLNQTT